MRRVSLLIFVTISFLFFGSSPAFAWDFVNGGDHGGADWRISANQEIGGTHTNIANFIIDPGVTVTVRAYNGSSYGTLEINSQTINIQGTLSANGVGYSGVVNAGSGPGQGQSAPSGTANAGGGSHGGKGGYSDYWLGGGPVYGNFAYPSTMGSSGGGAMGNKGGAGGGVLKLTAQSSITITGTVSSNGAPGEGHGGGGAGGSVLLIANQFLGVGGTVSTYGANSGGNGGGGGGGRIALHYISGSIPSWTTIGTPGWNNNSSENATIVFINDTTRDLIIKSSQSWYANPSADGFVHNYNSISLSNNSSLKLYSYYSNNTDGKGFTFNVKDFTVNAGSSINADGTGYLGIVNSTAGPGGGGFTTVLANGGGGSHGGKGGCSDFGFCGGPTYGNGASPQTLGSSGGGANGSAGGNGGGALKIIASGDINLSGPITANGIAGGGNGGGGAGGSIFLIANNILGTGITLAAVGNPSAGNGGGGGGGRIALNYYSSLSSGISTNVNGGKNGTIGSFSTYKYPGVPSNLRQYREDGTTPVVANGNLADHKAVFSFDLTNYTVGSTLIPQVEIRKNSESFLNTPNHQSSPITYSVGTSIAIVVPDATTWSDTQSPKRNLITIYNPNTSAYTNYQVNLNVPYDSDMKSDYSDLRFYGLSGTSLSYYVESYNSSSAIVWVKIPSMPATAQTPIYVYYGNASASSQSNSSAVFDFIEDFSGTTIDTSKWNIDNNTGFSVANGLLTGTNTSGRISSKMRFSYTDGSLLEIKNITPTIPSNGLSIGGFYVSPTNDLGWLNHPGNAHIRYDSTWTPVAGQTPNQNMLYSIGLGSSSSVSMTMYNLDTSSTFWSNTNVTNNVSQEPIVLGTRYDDTYQGQTYSSQWDWVRVRRYAPLDPSYSLSSEESYSAFTFEDLASYHWQARVCNPTGFCSNWVAFDNDPNPDFTMLFDILPPINNASSLKFDTSGVVSGQWTKQFPSISWTAASDNPGGTGIRGYCVSLVESAPGIQAPQIDPCSDDGLLPGDAPNIITGTSFDLSSLANLTLSSNKQYWFSIKSIDNVGNIFLGASDGSDYSNLLNFKYDNVLPTNVTSISAISGSYSSVSDFYFSWPTSGQLAASDAGSDLLGYQYSIGDTGNWHGTDTNNTFGITYLPIGTSQPYFLPSNDSQYVGVGANTIYFRTVDNAGNFSSPNTYRTALISFGGNAPSFPANSSVSVTLLDPNSSKPQNLFDVTWPTATSYQGNRVYKYYYMVNTTPPLNYNTIKSNSAVYIGVGTSNLNSIVLPNIHRGSNFIYVVAVDDNKDAQNQLSPNYSPSNAITASFDFNSDLPDPPQNVIVSDSSIKAASVWRASLAWDKPAYGGTGSLTFSVERSSDGITWSPVGTTSGYSYLDTVPKSQKYYWRVGSFDNSDDSKNSPSFANAVTLTPKGTYTTPADLTSGPTVSNITTKKAQITWSTSRVSDSKIAFGQETGKYFDEEPSNSNQVSEHTINLTNLVPGTTYYYVAKWTDEDGNTGTSEEKTFSTNPAPSIKDVAVSDISISSAIIKFTSKDASKVKLYYGKSSTLTNFKEISTGSNESSYTTKLDDLEDGTKYFYKINSFDNESYEYDTGITLDFTTLPRPKVSKVKIQQIPGTAQSTLLITWESNTEVSSIISYAPQSDPNASRDEVDVKLSKGDHKMLLKGLTPNTIYLMTVRGRDKVGNEAISDHYTFTTATDTRPPEVFGVAVEGTNVPAVSSAGQTASSQLIVSWTTDEPSTSQVEYGEGSGVSYQQKTQEDENLTLNHVVIISNLTPSKVYHLHAVSKDKASNIGNSIDSVTITPKATDNALDLVVSNLSQAFGFLNNINKN